MPPKRKSQQGRPAKAPARISKTKKYTREFEVQHVENGAIHVDKQVVRSSKPSPSQPIRSFYNLPENNLFTIPGVAYETSGTGGTWKKFTTASTDNAFNRGMPSAAPASHEEIKEPPRLVSDVTEEGGDPEFFEKTNNGKAPPKPETIEREYGSGDLYQSHGFVQAME